MTRAHDAAGGPPTSPLARMSRSSELAVSEMALLQDGHPEVFGETRDFGPHLGRSSSEAGPHPEVNSPRARFVSDSSPGESGDRSDSATINTPTQGFAPVAFTDRSPNTSAAVHPRPVPVQRPSLTAHLHSNGAASSPSEFKTRECCISEETSAEAKVPGEDRDSAGAVKGRHVIPNPLNITEHSRKEGEAGGGDSGFSDSPGGSSASGSGSSAASRLMGSSFSPLKAAVQHGSSLFNYTTSLFRSGSSDRDASSGGKASTSQTMSHSAQDERLNREIERLTLAPPTEEMR